MAECNGICIMGWEILDGASGVAYPHPDCDLHGWNRGRYADVEPDREQE